MRFVAIIGPLLFLICVNIVACEKMNKLVCGISRCTFEGKTKYGLRLHRFEHTDQRPEYCSKCGYSGFARHVTNHIRNKCKDSTSKDTILTQATKNILTMRAEEKKVEPPYYRCGIRECVFKSRHISKIAKHRRKKHITQKQYICSLCYEQCNEREGKRHIFQCSRTHDSKGKLIRIKLFATARDQLTAPVKCYYQNESVAMIEDAIHDDTYSIEYLSDSDEEPPPLPQMPLLEELLAIFPENNEESPEGSS